MIPGQSAGGLVTALEPLIQSLSGVWVAGAAGTGPVAPLGAPAPDLQPPHGTCRLRRVPLSPAERRGYYLGFANEGLWALCHRAHVQPIFRASDYAMYESVNARFARAVVDAVDSDAPLVLVQDYHCALAPRMIRDALHRSTVVTFWHIPWPDARVFEICPWGTQLLEGLLGSSVIGFQTARDCESFFDTVEATLAADVNRDQEVIAYKGRRTQVRAYPASIEWPNRWAAEAPAVEECRARVRRDLHLRADALVGVGVDRLDYTKGIVEKFEAIERLLERAPELRGRFVFAQIAEPTREQLPAYRDLRTRVLEARDRVNRRFAMPGYQPLILLEMHHEPPAVFRLLRAADLCYVGSLHDGMNLVAKEFVCARDDERGVLVLSAFAGAAQQLTAALIVNPYAVDRTADVLAQALRMTPDEQAIRLRAMRAVVSECNSCWWAGRMVEDAARTREIRPLGHRPHRPEPRRIPA